MGCYNDFDHCSFDHKAKHLQRFRVNKKQLLRTMKWNGQFLKTFEQSWAEFGLNWYCSLTPLRKIALADVLRLQCMNKRGRSYWHIHVANILNIGLSQFCVKVVFASQIIWGFIRKYISKLSFEMMSSFKTGSTRPSVHERWGNLVLENIWLPCLLFPKPFPKLEKSCQETSQQPNENVRI